MTNARKTNEILRDEYERLAREAERHTLNPTLSDKERLQASEEAKVFWQLSRNCADVVAYAADARPEKFTGTNKGQQTATKQRIEFIRGISEIAGTRKRQAVAIAAWKAVENDECDLFDNYEQIYRFLSRKDIFDDIRKP